MTEVKDVLDELLHSHFNNVEADRGGPMVQMDKRLLRKANDLFVAAYNALRAAESRATAAEGRVALLEEALRQAEQAIASLPDDALGMSEMTTTTSARWPYPIKLELLDHIRARLAKGGQ